MNIENKIKTLTKLFKEYRPIDQTIVMENPHGYRHKVISTFQIQNKKLLLGQYLPGSHKVVESKDDVLLEHPKAQKIKNTIKSLILKFNYEIYNEKKHQGLFRHVLLRFSYATDEIMCVFVVSDLRIPGKRNFAKELIKKIPDLTTIVFNENKRQTSIVLGDKNETVYGPGFIFDKIHDIKFKLSPSSFYQVNPEMMIKMYDTAIELADLKPTDLVVDAYCGIGTISLLASRSMAKIIGVELNSSSIKDALNNKKYNHIDNVDFICKDASEFIRYENKPNVIFMDPPREGSSKEFLEAVLECLPDKIVYISCNPKTCVRDIKYLDHKYTVSYLTLVDQFPMTDHVECIALLVKALKPLNERDNEKP